MEQNAELLRSISIPHITLYQNILGAIDEEYFEKVQATIDSANEKLEDHETDELNVVRPFFYDASIKINVYMTITENQIYNNPEADEDQKAAWEKYFKPVLQFIGAAFLAWSMGDTPLNDMMIIQQLEKVIQVIEDYHYPIETTDIELRQEEEKIL
jgi:hypothetical protein